MTPAIYFDRRQAHLLPRVLYADVLDLPRIIWRAISSLCL